MEQYDKDCHQMSPVDAINTFSHALRGHIDPEGRDVMHYLVMNEAHEVLKALLIHIPTISLDRQDSDFMTPLHLAVHLDLQDVASLLVTLGSPNMTLRDRQGTPFKNAYRDGKAEMMRILAPKSVEDPRDPANLKCVLRRLKADPTARIRLDVSAGLEEMRLREEGSLHGFRDDAMTSNDADDGGGRNRQSPTAELVEASSRRPPGGVARGAVGGCRTQ